jgi:hypothetical protein
MKVVDGIIAECIFNKNKAEEIGPVRNGGNWIFFEQVLKVKNGKTGCVIDHFMRKSHELIQFVQGPYNKIFRHDPKVGNS